LSFVFDVRVAPIQLGAIFASPDVVPGFEIWGVQISLQVTGRSTCLKLKAVSSFDLESSYRKTWGFDSPAASRLEETDGESERERKNKKFLEQE
jgi:hypothetical protein